MEDKRAEELYQELLECEDEEYITKKEAKLIAKTTPMLIDTFIQSIKDSRFGDSIEFISYDFNKEDNTYYIWHTNGHLSGDILFVGLVYNLTRKIFFNNKVYNVYFGFDEEKYEEWWVKEKFIDAVKGAM